MPSNAAIDITVTFGASRTHARWTDRRTMPFGKFVLDHLNKPAIGPKDGTCFVPGAIEGEKRVKHEVERITVAVLDADCGHAIEEIEVALRNAGLCGFIHSTASHLTVRTVVACKNYDRWRADDGAGFSEAEAPGAFLLQHKGYLSRLSEGATIERKAPGGREYEFRHKPIPKFRIAIPLARPWIAADHPAGADDWAGRIPALAEMLRLFHDQSCTDTSRLFYFSRSPDVDALKRYESLFVEGTALDIDALAVATEAPPSKGSKPPRAAKPGRGPGAPDRAPRPLPERADDPERFHIGDFNLKSWWVARGQRYEAAKALRARVPHLIGSRRTRGKTHIQCPFDAYHTMADDRTGTFVVNASELRHAGLPSLGDGFYIRCKHDSCTHRDRLDFIKKMVEDDWLTVGDLTDKQFLTAAPPLPELPEFHLPTTTGEEAGRRLGEEIKNLFAAHVGYSEARKWRGARLAELEDAAGEKLQAADEEEEAAIRKSLRSRATREKKAKFGPFDLDKVRLQIAAAAGTGKTRFTVAEYRATPPLWGEHIEFYAPTIRNCREVVEAINAEPRPPGMPLADVFAGMFYTDEDSPDPACLRHEIVSQAVGKVRSLYKSFCHDADIGARCPKYDICPFIRKRMDDSPKVRAMPHATLFTPQTPDLRPPKPDIVIVDESVILSGAAVKPRITVKLSRLADPESYMGADSDEGGIADAVALGEFVRDIVKEGPANVPGRMLEADKPRRDALAARIGHFEAQMSKNDPDCLQRRLRRAAKLASAGGDLAKIYPTDSDKIILEKLLCLANAPGLPVAALFRQLAWDVENGRDDSYGVEYTRAKNKGGDPSLRVHGLRNAESIGATTSLLIIDADAKAEWNNLIFAPDARPIPFIQILAKRLGTFHQADDFTGSRSSLLPDRIEGNAGSADRVARADKRRREIVEFAERRAERGRKVFVATTKPIRMEITGETEEDGKTLPANYRDPRGFDISSIGKIIGRNIWHKHDDMIQIGREQMPVEAVEELGRAIYSKAPVWLVPSLTFTGKYVRKRRRLYPGSDRFVDLDAHDEPRFQRLLELKREHAVAQNIDRMRLVYEDNRDVQIYILCNLPLPGVVPDRFVPLREILAGGTRIERCAAAGFLTDNAKVMAAVHHAIYETAKEAEHDIARGGVSQVLEKKANPQLASIDYRCGLGVCSDINDLATPLPITGRYRIVRPGVVPPRWSRCAHNPALFRRPDLIIRKGATDMDTIEFDGETKIIADIANRQDVLSERVAELTLPLGVEPTQNERDEFIAAALALIAADEEHPLVKALDLHTPFAAIELPSIVAPGRRFRVAHRTEAGVHRFWFFPEGGAADLVLWTDPEFHPIEPPAIVREKIEREYGAPPSKAA